VNQGAATRDVLARLAAVCLVLTTAIASSSGEAAALRSRPHGTGGATSPAIVTKTVEYKAGLRATLYRPAGKGPFPAVLLMHGGAFTTGDRFYFFSYAQQLSGAGFVAATIDYTLNAGYDVPTKDTVDAFEWLEGVKQVDPARVALVGWSAGGYLAELVGYRQHARAIVDIGSYDVVYPPGLDNTAPATLVVVGTDDTMAPLPKVQQWVDGLRARGVPVETIYADGVGHFDEVAHEWDAIQTWLVRQLDPPTTKNTTKKH
jgi:acetyl esterase/lipase